MRDEALLERLTQLWGVSGYEKMVREAIAEEVRPYADKVWTDPIGNLIAFDKAGNFSGDLLLCFFIIIWCSDVGAFTFGLSLGKRFPKKLFPSVSPKKTWVGFIGGFISAVLAAFVLYEVKILKFPLVHCLILAMVMAVSAVYGDLFESQWKRVYGVKDSGNIIPGHGGLLDRFDSTLMAMPFGAIYLALFDLL